jgi:hypothetical protein
MTVRVHEGSNGIHGETCPNPCLSIQLLCLCSHALQCTALFEPQRLTANTLMTNRELAEELGLPPETADACVCTELGCFRWQDQYCDVWGCAFVAALPPGVAAAMRLQADEVVAGSFMPLHKVRCGVEVRTGEGRAGNLPCALLHARA